MDAPSHWRFGYWHEPGAGTDRRAPTPRVGGAPLLWLLLPLLLLQHAICGRGDDASRPDILLYVPVHLSESIDGLREFAECTFRHAPTQQPDTNGFDMLVLLNGGTPDPQFARSLEQLFVHALAPHKPAANELLIHFIKTQDDTYEKGSTTQRSTNWVQGPNGVFYGTFASGEVYNTHSSRYKFVQQFETDVCTLRPGWLDALVAPLRANASVVVSGSSIKGDCAYKPQFQSCEPADSQPEFIQHHLNGNAMYRIGPELARIMNHSRVAHEKWPFDLAMYRTREDLGLQARSWGFIACAAPVAATRAVSRADVLQVARPGSVVPHMNTLTREQLQIVVT